MTVSTEIVDAVQQLLEKEGVLQSIRAQLRSSVINALATKDGERRASKTVEFTGKESGRGSILCVMDLLQKLNLRETMAVFEAEVGMIQTDVLTESARCDIMQRLNIVASLRDLDEPILYQLLENPSNKSSEKGTISRKMQDVNHQSESKISSLIPKVTQDSVLSASSILDSDGAFAERDFKQYDDAPRKVERRNSYEGQSAGPRGSLGYDSTDDSVADEKKSSEDTKHSAKDHKNNSDNRKFGLMAKHSADSDESRDRELSEDEILPEEEDVEEDAIEVGGDSGSSASFSLEYGYVDDPKSAVIKNETVNIIDKGTNAFTNDDKIERGIKSSTLQSIESTKVQGNSSVQESSSVGVKKFDQGSVTRSKTGWNEVTVEGGDKDSDEFLFSEEPESSAIGASPKSDLRKGVEVSNLNKNNSVKASSDQEIAKESKGVGASSSKSPPVARQSWGRNTDSKEVTRGGIDKASHSKGDVENAIEDEEAKSLSDDDDVINLEQLGRISGARIGKKSTNQEDEEDEETRKGSKSSGSGSLFKSRNLTGQGSSYSQHGSQSIQSSSSPVKKLSISIDEEDDGSVEFGPDDDGDLDFNGVTDTVTASPNSKLTEVERKLAQMEKDDVGLKSLRLQDDNASKAAAKDTDVGANNSEVEGDYSEGDFESDSENNSVVEVNEVSVASEDIEVMELSVGGAGSDSDSSFNAFNTDSSKRVQEKDQDKGKGSSLWNSSPPHKDATSTTREAIKPKSNGTQKSKNQDENEVSQSSAELEISVTELELTGSKGIDGNSGYDFTAAAVPPSKSNWGPRDRTSGR